LRGTIARPVELEGYLLRRDAVYLDFKPVGIRS
jgi:hypothetical protein